MHGGLVLRQEYKFFMGVFRDRTWEELRRIGIARGSWSDHFPFVFGQVKAFLLLQLTAVQSSILFMSRTVDKILQTCSVEKDSAATAAATAAAPAGNCSSILLEEQG